MKKRTTKRNTTFLATLVAFVMLSGIATSRITVSAAETNQYTFVFFDGDGYISIFYQNDLPVADRELSWVGNTLKFVNSGIVVTTNMATRGTPGWAEQGKYLVWQEPGNTAVVQQYGSNEKNTLSNVTAVTLDAKGFVETLTKDSKKLSVSEALASETNQATEKATEKETEQATEKATEQATEKATEQATEKSTEKATEQATTAASVINNYYGTVNNDNSSTTTNNNNYYYGKSKKETTSTTSSTSKKVVKVKKAVKLSAKNSKNHKVTKLYKGKKVIATLKISGRKILLGKKVIAKLSKKEVRFGLKYKKVAFTQKGKQILFVTNTGKVFTAKKSAPKKWTKVNAKKIGFNKSGFATLA